MLKTNEKINKIFADLFPINRSLTGKGNRQTLDYLKNQYLSHAEIKKVKSGTKVFDWVVPPEWNVKDAYVKNCEGKKIIDIRKNNLHLVSYSTPFSGTLSQAELLKKIHTIPDKPNWIPYRTSYYNRDWGFCCEHSLILGCDFTGPFEVVVDSDLNDNGELNWLEIYKQGKSEKEILISTYCCHPSLANDNLSGVIAATLLFNEIQNFDTNYSYRLIIVPETIGSIAFLAQADLEKIVGGMVVTCVGGPDKISIKEGFDSSHWINMAAHHALNDATNGDYIRYPFVPDGSDERQYSSPGIKIVTPSIHKSKYYEYSEYHTSADNLDFISAGSIEAALKVYINWIENIESYCTPVRIMASCEYQLGKRGMFPQIGGTLNQPVHHENRDGYQNRCFDLYQSSRITGKHLEAFNWLMHLSDGANSNFDISRKSGIALNVINEAIQLFVKNGLIIKK
jgi:aminopeptidase-like protein